MSAAIPTNVSSYAITSMADIIAPAQKVIILVPTWPLALT